MTFTDRVEQIQARILEVDPSLAGVRPDLGHADAAVWRNGIYHATLTYHSTAPVPSLSVTLLAGDDDEHPEALEIGLDDPDVVEMVARPIAALMSGPR